jgi:hypothetical protein
MPVLIGNLRAPQSWEHDEVAPSPKTARPMGKPQKEGPPASTRQVRELLAFLNDAGHTDFRDARRPMGFTQQLMAQDEYLGVPGQGVPLVVSDEPEQALDQLVEERQGHGRAA